MCVRHGHYCSLALAHTVKHNDHLISENDLNLTELMTDPRVEERES